MFSKNSQNEPFYISLDVALTFLGINGFEIEDEQMELYDAMISIAEKKMSKEQLAQLFEKLTVA